MGLRSKALIIATIFVFLISACGSDGGGQNDSAGTSSRTSHLFYKSGSISRVNPDNPSGTPLVLEPGETTGERGLFAFETIGIGNRQRNGYHTRTIIYGKGDGQLYKISALKTDSQIPVQISNETGVSKVCDTQWLNDLSDHNETVYLYELPGIDESCLAAGDNIWKMIRVGMTATDSPIIAKKVIRGIWDSDGAIIGFLAIEGQEIVRCEQDFQSCPTLISFLSEGENLRGNLLRVDDEIYHYNANTRSILTLLYTFSVGSPASVHLASDEINLYFADGVKLLSLPLNGSAPPLLLITESTTISTIALTANSAVYFLGASTVKAIGKSGGGFAKVLVQNDAHQITTSENLVYYNRFSLSSTVLSSGVINDDGTGVSELPGSFWNGSTRSSTLTPSGFSLKKMIRAEGCSVRSACRGATLKSFDAATHSGEIVMGTIPDDVSNIFLFGYEDHILGVGQDAGGKFDIFFANVNQSNSLKRITRTPTVDETQIGS